MITSCSIRRVSLTLRYMCPSNYCLHDVALYTSDGEMGDGAQVREGPELTSPEVTILTCGTEVTSLDAGVQNSEDIDRVRIVAPVSGWVSLRKLERVRDAAGNDATRANCTMRADCASHGSSNPNAPSGAHIGL